MAKHLRRPGGPANASRQTHQRVCTQGEFLHLIAIEVGLLLSDRGSSLPQ
jgi:hypothetical protein